MCQFLHSIQNVKINHIDKTNFKVLLHVLCYKHLTITVSPATKKKKIKREENLNYCDIFPIVFSSRSAYFDTKFI